MNLEALMSDEEALLDRAKRELEDELTSLLLEGTDK